MFCSVPYHVSIEDVLKFWWNWLNQFHLGQVPNHNSTFQFAGWQRMALTLSSRHEKSWERNSFQVFLCQLSQIWDGDIVELSWLSDHIRPAMPLKSDSASSRGSVPTIITINNEDGEPVNYSLLTNSKSNGLHKDTPSALSPNSKRNDKRFLNPSSASQIRKYSNVDLDTNWVS